jgi:RHS repeat-associated protein
LCKITTSSGEEITDATHIGRINPFRYRGYYYSEDLGLYYLKSRFYDPVTGRFISPDATSYLAPDTINGLNLYAYCNNNPVMNVDPDGHFSFLVFLAVVVASTLIGAVSGGVAAVRAGQNFWKGFAAGAIAGAIGGALSGLSGFLGHSLFFSLAGRISSSLSYSILNDKFQTGTVNWNNLGTYALDAAEDAMISVLYFKAVPALRGKFLPSITKDATERVVDSVISGVVDVMVDNFQLDIYSSSLSQTIRSSIDSFWTSMRDWTAPKMVLN